MEKLYGILLHMLRRTVVVLGGVIYVSKKLKIMREDPGLLLNKLSELVSKCRHENKFILVNSKVELKVEVKLKVAKLCILNSFAWYGIA